MRPEQQVANTTAIGRRQERVTNRHCSRVVFIDMFISQPALNIPDRWSLLGGPRVIAALGLTYQKMISSTPRRGTANNPHRQQRDLQQLHYT